MKHDPLLCARPAATGRGALIALLALVASLLAGCGSAPMRTAGPSDGGQGPVRGGGYYLDDGPGDRPLAELNDVPDATPRSERLHRGAMRPYVALGRSFVPMTEIAPYRDRGIASWYGRRYHGRKTATGETYDMYAMTAAHPTLPLPSYARVTNVRNGRSVVVRINDRGPFLNGRLIDLSYAAAHRLDIVRTGSGEVEVEVILPEDYATVAAASQARPPAAAPAVAAVASAAAETSEPETAASSDNAGDAAPAPVAGVPAPALAPAIVPVAWAAPPAPRETAAAPDGGVFLQLAAFGQRANAEDYLARLQFMLEELGGTLRIVSGDRLHRVQSGPYPNRDDAARAARRIAAVTGSAPLVTIR